MLASSLVIGIAAATLLSQSASQIHSVSLTFSHFLGCSLTRSNVGKGGNLQPFCTFHLAKMTSAPARASSAAQSRPSGLVAPVTMANCHSVVEFTEREGNRACEYLRRHVKDPQGKQMFLLPLRIFGARECDRVE